MARRVVGVELTRESTKLVEVSYARRLKVFNFAILDSSSVEPARRAEQLDHALKVKGFEASDVVVATSAPNIEHRLLTLPPMSARETYFIMQREAKKVGPGGPLGILWAYDVLNVKEELGIRKNQILFVTAERSMVGDVETYFRPTKLKLQQLTTVPEALTNLLRQIGRLGKETAKAVVHFSGTVVHVVFAQDGVLLLTRDVLYEYSTLSQDEQLDVMVNELKRSLLYFRQNFPQIELDQILLSGDSDILGTLAARSTEELGINSGILRFEDSLDLSGFRGNLDEFRFHLPSLATALGAVWRRSSGTGLNLLPGKTVVKEQGFSPAKLAKAAAAVGLATMLGTSAYYFTQRAQVDAQRTQINQKLSALDGELAQNKNIEQRRALADDRAAFLKRFEARIDWAEIFRSFSFIAPDTAVFESLRVNTGAEKPAIVINGYLVTATAAEANADFNRFFSALRAIQLFKNVVITGQPKLSFEDATRTTATPVSLQVRSRLSFEIRCEL